MKRGFFRGLATLPVLVCLWTAPAFADEETAAKPEDEAAPPPAPMTTTTARPSDGGAQRLIGIVLGGVGLAAAGTAVGLGLSALSARDDYEDSGFASRELYDRTRNLRLFTNVAWIASAVFLAGGGALYFTAGPSGATVAGRF